MLRTLLGAGLLLFPVALSAQADTTPIPNCASCAAWNEPQKPFRIFGNTWFVGTHGLSAVLVTSDAGHVLIDGALPQSAPQIVANVRALGFRMEDVRLVLNSHAHYDHAGGLAALARVSGATVAASAPSARVIERGQSGADDPQYGLLAAYPAVARVRVLADEETVRVGPLALTAHLTPGHTPGGTTWTWRSCEGTGEGARCLDLVYADSETPVSADDFFFTRSTTYPNALQDFARGHATLERLSCDVLITPHPDASGLWQRVAKRDSGDANALVDRDACKRYAANARKALADRVERERKVSSNVGRTRVVLLGTGTPNADPDRSGPAVAVVVDGHAYIVDAGPGVVRRAAAAVARDSIAALGSPNLRTVFLTHLHSDHTLGLPDLMFSPWVLGRTVPLAVYGPPGTRAMTEHLQAAYAEDIDVRLHGGEPSNKTGYGARAHDVLPGVVYRDSLVQVTAFAVPHGTWKHAYGYRFDTPDRSVVISGDTGPSDAVAKACNGCDVLVHEVISSSDLRRRTPEWQRYHNAFHTPSDSLGFIATRARPKLLVLYHQIPTGFDEAALLREVKAHFAGAVVSGRDLGVY